ncbi:MULTISPECIES: LTA synthase family protein [unclassified Clostridium]|uniref:LTA synthase family protein n=1 Tax=unclassified Clostridium TaxID=2614128 RepID=UPI00029768CD|nr:MULTISPECIES: LTA synthase family protein [unclassified Clostridium]EKQ50878.1 MAG: phosphoglycerol transferase family protein, alkaline phosphatase superfamily [Clostridium sp. Maddingley MBC34-26]
MSSFNSSINNFLRRNLNKDTIIRIIFFLIPVISIILKGIMFQGFVINKNPYSLDFSAGYQSADPFLNYYIAFAVAFISFSLLFRGIGRVVYTIVIDLLLTFLILIDVWYFRGFLTVPSALILTQTANLDNMSGSILSMTSNLDFIFLFDFIILAIYVYISRKSFSNKHKRSIKTFLCTFILSILYIIYVPISINVFNNKDVPNAYLFSNYDKSNTARYFSPIGYHIIDCYTVYRDSQPYKLTNQDKADIKELFETKKEDLPNNEYFGMAKGKNLIYIQVESLENFVIGKKINGKEITPNLNKLVQSSLYFPNTFEQVNEGTSSDADLMVNTSMLPLRQGSTFFRYPNTNYNSMPNILETQGYNTYAIHPDKGSFWNYKNGLLGIGFDNFSDYYSFNVDEVIGLGISDKRYFEQVIPMLKKQKQPFYTETVTLTSHGPFDIPEKYRELGLDPELNESKLGGYFESLHYTDKQIGYFIDQLDKEGLLKNSIIAIMGDHTGIHKYYDDTIGQLSHKEDWFLNTGNPTVPFIIYDPSKKQGKTFDEMYNGQIDVMPTLLYLLGVDKDKYENTALGRNLLNTNKSFAVITNGTLKGGENLTDKEKEVYKKSLDISDKMIRANYAHNVN